MQKNMAYEGSLDALVCGQARQAKALGCHGVVASGSEVASARRQNGREFAIFTPSIRMDETPIDDHKRVLNPEQLSRCGKTVGCTFPAESPARPIRTHDELHRTRSIRSLEAFGIKQASD